MKLKDTKRAEAQERQKIYDQLSKVQKLDIIANRRGESKKEKERILKGE